ncbi:hypothetical protein BDY21DRAFT_354358, partial [Lineolata rhizophorae]
MRMRGRRSRRLVRVRCLRGWGIGGVTVAAARELVGVEHDALQGVGCVLWILEVVGARASGLQARALSVGWRNCGSVGDCVDVCRHSRGVRSIGYSSMAILSGSRGGLRSRTRKRAMFTLGRRQRIWRGSQRGRERAPLEDDNFLIVLIAIILFRRIGDGLLSLNIVRDALGTSIYTTNPLTSPCVLFAILTPTLVLIQIRHIEPPHIICRRAQLLGLDAQRAHHLHRLLAPLHQPRRPRRPEPTAWGSTLEARTAARTTLALGRMSAVRTAMDILALVGVEQSLR